jgi:hypothetical protein
LKICRYYTSDIPSILAKKYKIVEMKRILPRYRCISIIYLTIFTKASFNNKGRTWFTMINIDSDENVLDNDNSKFTFDLSNSF